MVCISISALASHSMGADEYDVDVVDQCQTPITEKNFKKILKNFDGCSSFTIEIICKARNPDTQIFQKEIQDVRIFTVVAVTNTFFNCSCTPKI